MAMRHGPTCLWALLGRSRSLRRAKEIESRQDCSAAVKEMQPTPAALGAPEPAHLNPTASRVDG
eukprot:100344-Chlamydomonas_euryale.AAC.3